MPREGTSSEAEWLATLIGQIDSQTNGTLSRTLYQRLRSLLSNRSLSAGLAMPASRQLAGALGLSRNTVLAAYEQLIAEGFLETRAGAGTFVAEMAVDPAPHQEPDKHPGLGRRGLQLMTTCNRPGPVYGAFVPGIPALDAFPVTLWQRYQARYIAHPKREWLGYTQQGGLPELRAELARYLTQVRGVRASADTILITQGAQQALELLARLLADPGDVAWIEEPGYLGAQAALTGAALQVQGIAVDEQGIDPASALAGQSPRLIYVTPSHQYPTGVVMSLARRRELLAAAERHDAWIIEDDYDSEFRYRTEPIAALQGLSDSARVIYLGTFSKVLYPGLRLAYMVLPPALVEPFRAAYSRLYREGPYPTQAALADFIADGHFSRHVRRMRTLYQQRQTLLRQVLAAELGNALTLSPGEAGLHLLAELPPHFPTGRLIDMAAAERIWLRSIAQHYFGPPLRNGLVLGYAGVPEAEIERAGHRLGQLLSSQLLS
jgi:GntR family transcriptional regulator/MocR family aminotransferase